ncbi:AI-2E family transporter [Flavisphingomonas formosensis]|uniref:AI-2E family transporter n=1 Tax=Flavisphingomonas formosensis TaxID=861534 RepID=UPI0012FC214E|nr:AI-2E family transporter [Sphingomonas formosensis]
MRRLEDNLFLALVLAVSIAFAWIVQPFFGAVLWAFIAAVLFMPLNDRLLRLMPTGRNRAALLTLLVIVAMVIVPAVVLAASLLQEASSVYLRVQAGEVDFGRYVMQVLHRLPSWVVHLFDRLGLTNFDLMRARLQAGFAASFQTLAAQAFSIGQSAFGFLMALGVMLYLSFFLLRDGRSLAAKVEVAVPLHPHQRSALMAKFIAVVRATVKGSLVVAALQGAIGGIVFWALGIHGALLWGVSMAIFSLLPAIGTGLVWVPVAIYLLVTGAIWQGIVLVLCGLFVIGMVDNVLRPILVGHDTRMPDYVVLISTLGGIEVFGFNGFIIGPVIAALFIAMWDILSQSRAASAEER